MLGVEDVGEEPGIADPPRGLFGLPNVGDDLRRLADPNGERRRREQRAHACRCRSVCRGERCAQMAGALG